MQNKLYLLLFSTLLFSCSGTKVLMQTGEEESFRSVKQYVQESETLNDYFFGMTLYDLEDEKEVYSHQADHFFTPASVTKILTLYTATHFLKDSLAWMNVYDIEGKTVYEPMGDPSFLHPDLETPERILTYFEQQPQDNIYWSEQHFQDEKYGSGWAWDDYTYSFQPQKSAFPIQSNLLRFEKDSIYPTFIPAEVYFDLKTDKPRKIWGENQFFVEKKDEVSYLPFETNDSVLKNYFVERYKTWIPYKDEIDTPVKETVYSIPAKEAYKVLMQESDNHIAEQLLLQASQLKLGEMNTKKAIEASKRMLLDNVKNELQWVDGSGLSRYNMVTPNAVTYIINQLKKEQGLDWMKEVFPAGGESGTIRNNYAYSPPRVFAKTGTLRHNHNLAGIVQAKSGKWYSFCMMNNHFNGSSAIAKREMENLLEIIIERY